MRSKFIFWALIILRCPAIPGQVHSVHALVELDSNLGKVIYHEVDSLQTLYSISRSYGVTQEQIIEANKLENNRIERLPHKLTIPLQKKDIHTRKFSEGIPTKELFYRVKAGDNLFRVSKSLHVSLANLKEYNHLEGDQIRENQFLLIGWLKPTYSALKVTEGQISDQNKVRDKVSKEPEAVSLPLDNASRFRMQEGYPSFPLINEIAIWNSSLTGKEPLVMHRKAEPGVILEIYNPMSGKKVYARVSGRIPENLYSPEVSLVLNAECARLLEVRDPRIFLRCRYPYNSVTASR